MIVPKNQIIWIGNRKYKAGETLPANYVLKEIKQNPISKKKDNK